MPIAGTVLSRSREAIFGSPKPKRRVKTALIAAGGRFSTTDSFTAPKQLIRVDSGPVIHLLVRSLHRAGIERIIIATDNLYQEAERQISRDANLRHANIEWIHCKASLMRGQASSVMTASHLFRANEPFLLIANIIYEQELLERLVKFEMPSEDSTSMITLVDDASEMVFWAMADHCAEFCRHGHCNVLVKVLLGDEKGQRGQTRDSVEERDLVPVVRIAKKMKAFDALDVGAHLVWPRPFFSVMQKLLEVSPLASLVDAMQELCTQGRHKAMSTGKLKWYSDLTISSLGAEPRPNSAIKREWREHCLQMLSEVHSTCLEACEPGKPPGISPLLLSQSAQVGSMPSLIELGETIGEGAQGRVIHGMGVIQGGFGSLYKNTDDAGAVSASTSYNKSLAVKIVKKGQPRNLDEALQELEDGELGDAEAVIMWEVHVLRELERHDHIVRLMDVVDLVDSTYIVMERIDGPELTTYIELQPGGKLPIHAAQRVFAQLLQALHHAHARGFLHCDVKPANVRLDATCERAVLTDWGFAQRIGRRVYSTSRGTPAYAAPELLTGYCSDSFSGRRPLCPAVDVWALGVTLYQMLTGLLPFEGSSMEELIPRVLRLQYTPPQEVPWECTSIVDSMLQLSPLDRAGTRELLAAQWSRDSGALLEEFLEADICQMCEDGDELSKGGAKKAARGWPKLKQALIALFYLSLCGILLNMHGEKATDATDAPRGVATSAHARRAPATQTYESRANHR